MKRSRIKGAESRIPNALLKGSGVCILLTLIGSGIISWLVMGETIRESGIGYSIMGLILLTAIIGSMTAMGRVDRNHALTGALMGIIYWIILLGGNLLLCKGEWEGLWVTLFLALGGAIGAIFLQFRPKRKRYGSRRKIASR